MEAVRKRIEEHVAHTGSARGKEILVQWTEMSPKFLKVLPRDYERMLNAFKKVEEQGLSGDEAAMAAFEGKGTFQELLAADDEVKSAMSEEQLAQCFSLDHAIRHADAIIDRVIAAP